MSLSTQFNRRPIWTTNEARGSTSFAKIKGKIHVKIVVIRLADHGESTKTGHLINKSATELMEKDSFKWESEKLKAERDRKLTFDTVLYQFETATHVISILDAPGHKVFIRDKFTGTAQPEFALLFAYEAIGMSETNALKNGQTDELLAFPIGVKELTMRIFGMDSTGLTCDSTGFEYIKKEINTYNEKIGHGLAAVDLVPISGRKEDNVLDLGELKPLFKEFTVECDDVERLIAVLGATLSSSNPTEVGFEINTTCSRQIDLKDIGQIREEPEIVFNHGNLEPDVVVINMPIDNIIDIAGIQRENIVDVDPSDDVSIQLEDGPIAAVIELQHPVRVCCFSLGRLLIFITLSVIVFLVYENPIFRKLFILCITILIIVVALTICFYGLHHANQN